jgi:hypothetical protein
VVLGSRFRARKCRMQCNFTVSAERNLSTYRPQLLYTVCTQCRLMLRRKLRLSSAARDGISTAIKLLLREYRGSQCLSINIDMY